MKHFNSIKIAACSALFVAALIPPTARADDWNKRTVITFSDTVQVPGATLPAGTYVFRLRDSRSDRFTVQILNERENHMYATVLAIPDYHDTAPEKTLVSFYEAPVGQPTPIKAWFSPGDKYGREFVYSKHESVLIAAAANETVPSEETYGSVASAQTQPAPPVAEQSAPAPAPPVTTQEQTAQAVTEPQPAPVTQSAVTPEPAPEPATEPTTEQTTTLPSTASEWPLAGLIGLSSLAGALVLRAVRKLS